MTVNFEQLKSVISNDHTERLKMRGYKSDCDDFSLQLSAAIYDAHAQEDKVYFVAMT